MLQKRTHLNLKDQSLKARIFGKLNARLVKRYQKMEALIPKFPLTNEHLRFVLKLNNIELAVYYLSHICNNLGKKCDDSDTRQIGYLRYWI